LKTQDATGLKRLLQVAREVKAMQLGFVARGPRATRLLEEHGPNGGKPRSRILDAIESESAGNPILDAMLGEVESTIKD
jgi:hypothetical protein